MLKFEKISKENQQNDIGAVYVLLLTNILLLFVLNKVKEYSLVLPEEITLKKDGRLWF